MTTRPISAAEAMRSPTETIAMLRKALEFYANPFDRTDADGETIRVPDFYDELCFGERAIEALARSAYDASAQREKEKDPPRDE